MTVRAYVLGVDPGKMSGIALVALDESEDMDPRFARFSPRLIMCSTAKMRDFVSAIREYLTAIPAGSVLIVSCERYIVTRMSQQTQDTQSLEITGRLNAALELLEWPHTFVQYKPSEAKTHWGDKTLRELGFNVTGTTDHARDALRHALEWCMRYAHNAEQIA